MKKKNQFFAGQQKLMPELLCMIAPTCNSFTRLVPGFWAPTQATWGVDNHYALTREWEANEQQKAVTNWQLNRYFEII